MLFNSYIFIFAFLPLTLGGFILLSKVAGHKAAKIWLTLASLFFYGWWNPVYVGLIVPSMLFNFWLGRRIGLSVGAGRSGRALLTSGLVINLLLLGYFKYANFFVSNANALFGTGWVVGKIILPLGISFFTFTQIAYLIDASRGVVCEYDLGDFLLFITFFPHLIAGPIIHHREMMPQFAEPRTFKFHWDNLAVGLWFFSAGLFKKVIVADTLSVYAVKVFDSAASGKPLYAIDAWAGLLSYTFQIYFDFSGYSDMAIGLARMFGITLPLNFNSPYKAVNIIEFWRCWHMTLSRFLRDYLYIPLGGNRLGTGRRYLNLILTMLIGGLWHGAAWTFVLWGFFHGLFLAINHLWQGFCKSRKMTSSPPAGISLWAGRALTFLLVMFAWGLFRAADFHSAGRLFGSMVAMAPHPAAGMPAILKPKLWIWLTGLLAFVWLAPNTAEMAKEHQVYANVFKTDGRPTPAWKQWQMTPAWACFCAILILSSILSLSKVSEFLYYNF